MSRRDRSGSTKGEPQTTNTRPAPGVRRPGGPGGVGTKFCPRAAFSGCTHAVLSIGKLSAGQARYYLEQGEARVDAVDSISDGVEEYYAGGAEARGTWIGSAARRSASRARSTATRCGASSPALIRWMERRCGAHRARSSRRVRPDVLGAEERQRPVRDRRPAAAHRGPCRARPRRSRSRRLSRAFRGGGPSRPWRR